MFCCSWKLKSCSCGQNGLFTAQKICDRRTSYFCHRFVMHNMCSALPFRAHFRLFGRYPRIFCTRLYRWRIHIASHWLHAHDEKKNKKKKNALPTLFFSDPLRQYIFFFALFYISLLTAILISAPWETSSFTASRFFSRTATWIGARPGQTKRGQ